jgi:hypothetical protein
MKKMTRPRLSTIVHDVNSMRELYMYEEIHTVQIKNILLIMEIF